MKARRIALFAVLSAGAVSAIFLASPAAGHLHLGGRQHLPVLVGPQLDELGFDGRPRPNQRRRRRRHQRRLRGPYATSVVHRRLDGNQRSHARLVGLGRQ